MINLAKHWVNSCEVTVRTLWIHHHLTLLRLAIVLMGMIAVFKLSYEFDRLIREPGVLGAIDLLQRYNEVQVWFAQKPVYGELATAVYPPASYVMLWPFLGYTSSSIARWIWAVTTIVALVGLVHLTINESCAKGRLERPLATLIPLAMYGTGETIGNGQLTIFVLVAVVVGLRLLNSGRKWGHLWLGSALVVFSLVKPTITLPFLWLVLVAPGGRKSLLWIGLGYTLLAFVGGIFQDGNIISLHQEWLNSGIEGAVWGSGGVDSGEDTRETAPNFGVGYGNLHSWLAALGLSQWNLPVTLFVLLLFGGWTYLHRSVNLWLLLGVAAIVSRLWTYHLVYDDMVMLLPMITLFRLTKGMIRGHSGQQMLWSGIVLAIAIVASWIPPRLRLLPPPWDGLFKVGQTSVWMAMLVFLLYWAWCERSESNIELRSHSG
jgi:hypothetical protein